jgi:hypothetical protein
MTDLARLNEELQRVVLARHATPSERALLAAAADPNAIVIKLGFETAPGRSELISRPAGAEPVAEGQIPDTSHETVRAILRRVELRKDLGLPAHSCAARRPRQGCDCLEVTLDVLGKGEPSKRDVTDAVTELHKPTLAEAKRLEREHRKRQAEAKRAVVRAKLAQAPSAILDSIPKPSIAKTEQEKPKRPWQQRGGLEPENPLSWDAFKRQRDGDSWRDRQF